LPFREARAHLIDIRESIESIDGFLKGMDFDAYHADLKTRLAVERQLQIISEAAARLKDAEGLRGSGPECAARGLPGLISRLGFSHDRRYLAGLLRSQLWSLPSHSAAKMI
jgi:hypothetical protein